LTALTSLDLSIDQYQPTLTAIQNLTNMKSLAINILTEDPPTIRSLRVNHLTNMEKLDVSLYLENNFLDDLVPMTNLTSLKAQLTAEQYAHNSTCLASLPLLEFVLTSKCSLHHGFVTNLTRLRKLEVSHVDSEEFLLSLTSLTNLTTLHLIRSNPLKGIHLTCLTNLQCLRLGSSAAQKSTGKKGQFKKYSAKMPYLYSWHFK
jgi:hypothetical protein